MNAAPPFLQPCGDPVEAAIAGAHRDPFLAVISDITGPSYRPLGAMMCVFDREEYVGTLSSGCVEKDIALQALAAKAAGEPLRVQYGQGSPFKDIVLPCGGGLEITLIPAPNMTALKALQRKRVARIQTGLIIDLENGAIDEASIAVTTRKDKTLHVASPPALQFIVFGKGPESVSFTRLAQTAGYAVRLLSPDQETLDQCAGSGCQTIHLTHPHVPNEHAVDEHTAVVLFFHDHDWEPPIIADLEHKSAGYIGAQGSLGARATRDAELQSLGVSDAFSRSVFGPVGLVRSARDPVTLSVSVLAEILSQMSKR